MKTVIKMVSSGFYVGYSPVASGTLGSVWGVLIYLQLKRFPAAYILAVILLYILGFLICGEAEKVFGKKDSARIVIDEIPSMCLVYLFIKPTWLMLILGFVIYRIFDILKPPPARRIEVLAGSKGVMLDDIIAAVYTIAALFIINAIMQTGIPAILNR